MADCAHNRNINGNYRGDSRVLPPNFGGCRGVNPNLGVVTQQPNCVINSNFIPQNQAPFVYNLRPSLGIPVDSSVLRRMDDERTISVLRLMEKEGIVPSSEEEEKRKIIIQKLKEIVVAWAKRISWQRGHSIRQIRDTYATILTYGSYGLGVHGPESDIDAVCLGPYFATMAKDFFVTLRNMLRSREEVTELHCVKDAKVPLMRFKFDGVLIDLPYARLKLHYVPESVNVLDPFFLRDIDDTSWKSLSGVRANKRILQLVPNVQKFQDVLRCIKLWARRRGVYGNLYGYLGGVHLAILTAFVCQIHPRDGLSALISRFFATFAQWSWPAPVILRDPMCPPTRYPTEMRSLMPIHLPCSPHEYCHSNITRSTYHKIKSEFSRGFNLTRDVFSIEFNWCSLVEPYPYSKKFSRFVKIYLSTTNQDELGDWVGWVKSRFRSLIIKVEDVQGLCDPNPTEFVDADATEPNAVFYWGLLPGRMGDVNIESIEKDFSKNIYNGYQGSPGKMKLSVIDPHQLPLDAQNDVGTGKRTKACWKISEHCPRRLMVPLYSQHLPHYFIGYVSTNRGTNYLSGGN